MILNIIDDFDEIKIALKIDGDDDDIEVKRAFISATSYVKGAIGNDKPSFYNNNEEETTEMLNLAILMLADHYYKTRSATLESANASGSAREYDLGFTSIILQLKGAYAMFKEGVNNVD